jgi:hypothetical protein
LREKYAAESGIHYAGGGRNAHIGYNSTVCVEVDVATLVEPRDYLGQPDDVLESIDLFIDGGRQSDVVEKVYYPTLNTIDGSMTYSGPYTFCWRSELGVGTHHVLFRFRKTSGVVCEYAWDFIISHDKEGGALAPSPSP